MQRGISILVLQNNLDHEHTHTTQHTYLLGPLTPRTTRSPAQTTAGTLLTPTLWETPRLWGSEAAHTPVLQLPC
jgi:hypothetical protein